MLSNSNLHALSGLIDPTDKASLYGRLSSLRDSVHIVARTEPLSSRVTWHDNDQRCALSWAYIKERSFNLSDVRMATFLAVEELNEACQQLFPVTIWESLSLSSLSVGSFVDNWEEASMFHQTHNSKRLTPLITKLLDQFTRVMTEKGDTISSIIERSQTFLTCFAVALYLTTIPPYARQTVELKYASDGTSDRNFRLMDRKHGVLVWQPGREGQIGYGRKGSDCAWFIPPQVTLPLIIYLGIVRPVEIRLIGTHALRMKAPTDVHLLETHIFCNSLRRASAKSMLWSPDNLEEALKSGPLKMEAFPHRLLFSAIIERKHAELLRTLQQPSVVDAQGQHTPKTSQMHYAVLQLQHTTGFHISGYMKQLLACQALHTFCFLGKPVAGLVDATECMALDTVIHRNQVFAFNVARDMVATRYKFAMSSRERAAVLSRTAYVNAPFLFRNSLPGCEQSDELSHVMVSLVSATVMGAECPIQIHPASVARLMASAGTLVSLQ
jgi:hypothetical protein